MKKFIKSKSHGCKSSFKGLRKFMVVFTFSRAMLNPKVMEFSPLLWHICSGSNLLSISLQWSHCIFILYHVPIVNTSVWRVSLHGSVYRPLLLLWRPFLPTWSNNFRGYVQILSFFLHSDVLLPASVFLASCSNTLHTVLQFIWLYFAPCQMINSVKFNLFSMPPYIYLCLTE